MSKADTDRSRLLAQPTLADVIDLMLDAICVVDAQGHFLFVSAAFERIFGFRPDEVIGRQMLDLVHPEDHERTIGAVEQIVAGNEQLHFENRYVRKDGRVVQIMWSARWSPDHQVRVAVARDITARKRAESMQAAVYAVADLAYAAIELETLCDRVGRLLAPLVPYAGLRVIVHDEERGRLDFTKRPGDGGSSNVETPGAMLALCEEVRLTGSAMALDRDTSRITRLDDPPEARGAIDWVGFPLATHDHVFGVMLAQQSQATSPPAAADLELLHFASLQLASAIERKTIESRLLHGAGHDPLTGLPNRSLVRDRMTAALAHARRNKTDLALLYLDIDRFKEVNDRLGHGAGDALLQGMASRLRRCVRESDTVGRMGGDEFVVMLAEVRSENDASSIAEMIRLAASSVFDVEGQSLSVSASIGIARYPADGDDYEQLLDAADEAMYRSKKNGGDRITVSQAEVAVV